MNISSNELRSKRTLVVEVVETFAPYDELESQYAPPNIVNTSDQLLLHFIPAFLKPANVEQSSSCGRQVQCVHVVVNLVVTGRVFHCTNCANSIVFKFWNYFYPNMVRTLYYPCA
ncbi:hypothetical protein Y032_0019g3946 [Ancylostoma ceylanicum]|uniref:Uncharacterized protein n=1 Tax=Ancylostoma ceylanicum TaxID=53326 RepID=A0A016V3S9_9BILA|nr:hypothetical protein Y032_0019g3946 [Ancylostoma ceylanicum]